MYTQQSKENGRGRNALDLPAEPTSTDVSQLGQTISLQDVLRTVKKRFWVLLLVPALLVAAVLQYERTQTPMYEASSTILVGQNSGYVQAPGDQASLKDLAKTMAQAVTSRPVVEAANQQLNPQSPSQGLSGNLEAEAVNDTQFIRVTYTDTSPQSAQQTVNAVGEAFSEQVAELQGQAAAATADAIQQASASSFEQAGVTASVPVVPPAPTVTATVWERAEVPGAPISPNPGRDALIALALGLMLGLGLAFLLEHLLATDSWRSPDEVELVSGVPIVGVIPK